MLRLFFELFRTRSTPAPSRRPIVRRTLLGVECLEECRQLSANTLGDFTPPQNPALPPGVPIPYPNTQIAAPANWTGAQPVSAIR